jgi:endonuclease/exonuclease/phosphatase family metal-dependent hydrolase
MPESVRVLTWNLFQGHAVQPAGRSLLTDFSAALAGWEWDVALLQEVPHWWAPRLGAVTGAEHRRALTSRNWVPPLQRMVAERFPDVVTSGGGGSNVLLARTPIGEHRRRRLRWWPERRMVHAVRLSGGLWAANFHATVRDPLRATADVERARAAAVEWSGGAPVVLGGDFNLRRPVVPGFVHAGTSKVDHIFARGLGPVGPAEVIERGHLSDHAPLAVTLRPMTARRM